jgi:hypothetical protein
VTSSILDSPTYVVGSSVMGSDGPVLYPACLVVSGIACEPCGGLYVVPDCLM